jgi:hypothetical protein
MTTKRFPNHVRTRNNVSTFLTCQQKALIHCIPMTYTYCTKKTTINYLFMSIITTFIVLLTCNPIRADDLVRISSEGQLSQYKLTMSGYTKDVYIAGDDLKTPSSIVYIFHGYKPAGDPYKQAPSYYASYWNLQTLSKNYNIIFVIPDNGDSVYPIYKADAPPNDLFMLEKLHMLLMEKYTNKPRTTVIGFSAGVEGAIKFSPMIDNHEIIAISGNYRLTDLPPGEKAYHEKVFGSAKFVWDIEDPIKVLTLSGSIDMYLFCEEKNTINIKQAQYLASHCPKNVTLHDMRPLGKGFSHDWKFLTSKGILESLEKILSGKTK